MTASHKRAEENSRFIHMQIGHKQDPLIQKHNKCKGEAVVHIPSRRNFVRIVSADKGRTSLNHAYPYKPKIHFDEAMVLLVSPFQV
jgi:hypothetical protein